MVLPKHCTFDIDPISIPPSAPSLEIENMPTYPEPDGPPTPREDARFVVLGGPNAGIHALNEYVEFLICTEKKDMHT